MNFNNKERRLAFIKTQPPSVVYAALERQEPSLIGKNYSLVKQDLSYVLERESIQSLSFLTRDGDCFFVDLNEEAGGEEEVEEERVIAVTDNEEVIEIQEEEVIAVNHQHIVSLSNIKAKLFYMKKEMEQERSRLQMFIRRDHLLDDVMEQIDSIDRLYVRFEGEIGEDRNGLSKGLFSDFWIQFLKRFGRGTNRFFLSLSVEMAPQEKHLIAAGRMLILGVILYSYIPSFINDAVLFFLLCSASPSSKLLKESFYSCLDDSSGRIIQDAEKCTTFSPELIQQLVAILGQYEINSLPSKKTFSLLIDKLSKHCLIQKPFFFLYLMQKGANEVTSSPFLGLSEELFISFVNECRPTGNEILMNLNPEHSENPEFFGHEERVLGFLETFVQSFDDKKAAVFMKFVSGCEHICEIKILFNGEVMEELMVPKVNTCGVVLHLSRYIISQRQFDNLFFEILNNREQLWNVYDSI